MAPRDTASTDWQVNYPEIKMRSAHLLRSREWADCAFVFETGAGDAAPSLEAHRLILAMASPVFAAMFYGHVGDKEGPVHISDIDQTVFSSMLDYIYTDEVEITSTELASGLFRAAHKYILVHLEQKCINYLLDKLCPQNVCHVYELSCMFNEDELMLKCVEMFSTKTLDILKASSFKDAQVETLRKIYSMDSLNIDSELDLFEALLEYTKKAQFNDDNDDAVSASESQEDNKDQREVSQQATNDGTPNEKSTDTADLNSGVISTADIKKERIIAARQNIPGLIEQIRFLTLTASELANCENLSTLLTESEINALILKISSLTPLSLHKMPKDFSTTGISRSQVDKNRSIVTMPIEIKNVMSKISTVQTPLKYEFTKLYSKIFYIRDIPWECEISYYNKVVNEENNSDNEDNDDDADDDDDDDADDDDDDILNVNPEMVVVVKCLLNKVLRTWTCQSSCKVDIVPNNTNIIKQNHHKLLRKSSSAPFSIGGTYGHRFSFSWNIITALSLNLDDTINLNVQLTIKEVVRDASTK